MLTDYFDIDSILSLIKKTSWLGGFDEKMAGGFNGILNILFSIGKSIVEASMVLVDKIFDPVNKHHHHKKRSKSFKKIIPYRITRRKRTVNALI